MKITRVLATILVIGFATAYLTGCQEGEKAASKPDRIGNNTAPGNPVAPNPANPAVKATPTSADQTQVPQAPETTKETPTLKLNNAVHNFGDIGPVTSNDAVFKFSNTGEADLYVSNVITTCGCTQYDLSARTLKPGDSAELKVTYSASSYPGSVQKHLYLVTNDPKNPRAELTIEANIVLQVKVDPKTMDLRLDKPNAAAEPIKLRSTDGKKFSIVSMTSTGNMISADFDPTAEATEFLIQPKVDVETLRERLSGAVQFNLSHPDCRTVSVTFSAKPLYELPRPRIVLQNAEPGVPVVKDTWIKSNYGEPIEIESIESAKGYMKVIEQNAKDDVVEMKVEFTPPQPESKVTRYFSDRITIKLRGGQALTINGSGWYNLR